MTSSNKALQWRLEFEKAPFAYPYDPADGREDPEAGPDVRRVLSGGTWYLDRVVASAAYRDVNRPDVRYDEFGFRVMAGSSIST